MAATVDIRDEATFALRKVKTAIRREVQPAIGAAAVKLFQNNFLSLGTNRYGFPSTFFWSGAAKSTNYDVLTGGVNINVNQQGVRQRLEGGTISRADGGNLAWGVTPDTYGVRAKQYMLEHPDARIAFRRIGGKVKAVGIEAVRATASVVERKTRGKDKGAFKAVAELIGRVLLYRFAKSVYQKPNPNVIPSTFEIAATAISTVNGIVRRAMGGAA